MTGKAMTRERFARLVAAYGADPARWPAAERAGAIEVARRPENLAVLADAAALDAQLQGYSVDFPGAPLVHRVAAGAPRPAARWRRAGVWWSGLGLAGVGAAGAMLGALMIQVPATGPSAAGDPDSYAWSYDQVLDEEEMS